MSNDENKLQRQIADIDARYLKRTLGELEQLHPLLQAAQNGAFEAAEQIELLAHKIHGSGAIFGFDDVSARADELERLAATGNSDSDLLQLRRRALQCWNHR